MTALLIGRVSGPSELGAYALAFSIIMLMICLMRAVLISPFVVVRGQLEEDQLGSMRASMLLATLLLGAISALVALVVASSGATLLALVMALALPAGLLRDFGRRLSIAELNLRTAITLDAMIAAVQLSLVGGLALAGQLTAVHALLSCSVTWLTVSLGGLVFSRLRYRLVPRNIAADLFRLWPVGRWVGMSQLLSTAQAFVMPWIMAIAHSLELAGIYAACWTIVQIASPAVEGLGNLLGPALARSAAEQAWRDFGRQVRVTALVFGVLMGGMTLAVTLAGSGVLSLLYGEPYAEYYPVLLLLMLAASVISLGIPASKALTQFGHAAANFWITLAGLTVSSVLALTFLLAVGVTGAAWGLIVGGCVTTVTRWALFRRHELSVMTSPARQHSATASAAPRVAPAKGGAT